tara:strand:+ start:17144 stop:17395 length:252 start_codon:yes stop_codon:yes gene_type:complete
VVFNGQTESGNLLGDDDDEDTGRNTDQNFTDRWGFFGVMYRLSGGDITKLNEITETSLYVCLTWLCYETDLESVNKNQRDARK